jgi:hypothetical protein
MNTTLPTDEEIESRARREGEIFLTLDPAIPRLTRIIMAQDIRAAEEVLVAVRAGTLPWQRGLAMAGSYTRIDTLWRLMDEGFITKAQGLAVLPELWPGSDPDDTDERFIALWEEAFVANGCRPVGAPLPTRRKTLTLWRGQRPTDPIGCAWSLSRQVAERFARGASFRVPIADGALFRAPVPREMVLAYLTSRNEDEVIISPKGLEIVR